MTCDIAVVAIAVDSHAPIAFDMSHRTTTTMSIANARAKNWGWQTMQRNPIVYVQGGIRHPDHNTVTLHDWHQVAMNTENQSRAMRNVAFLD